jgi:hypothetical protein
MLMRALKNKKHAYRSDLRSRHSPTCRAKIVCVKTTQPAYPVFKPRVGPRRERDPLITIESEPESDNTVIRILKMSPSVIILS